MKYLDFLRLKMKKIVFVWDDSDRIIESADQFAIQVENSVVHSVQALPHESIYNLGVKMRPSRDMTLLEKRQHLKYWHSVKSTQLLAMKSRFEVLFGDRIEEVAKYANLIKAEYILTRRFEQSSFSRWIHGDLNNRLVQKACCPVIFIDAETGGRTSISGATIQLQTK